MCEYLVEISSLFNEYSERLLQITEEESSDSESSESTLIDSLSDSDENERNNLKVNEPGKSYEN